MNRISNAAITRAEQQARVLLANREMSERVISKRILDAFRAENITASHLVGSTGYGYGDAGRDALERVFARSLGTEAALVRPHIASGTHALAVALFGILLPGDALLYATGMPYDTLHSVIGIGKTSPGDLSSLGISYREIAMKEGALDLAAIAAALRKDPAIRVVALQRSRGYDATRPSLPVSEINAAAREIHRLRPDVFVMVDNCYGEFCEEAEPAEADLLVGSLIKNPGGGIASTGGYVAGRRALVERCAARLYAPGVGAEIGSYEPGYRLFYQGLFLAPHTVTQALGVAAFTAALFSEMGYEVSPRATEARTDIIQSVSLKTPERLIAFCRAIQANSPIDSGAVPEPWDMPGYQHQVIMAAGAFVLGASIELSADAPLREPYAVFLQGSLTYEYGRAAVLAAAAAVGDA